MENKLSATELFSDEILDFICHQENENIKSACCSSNITSIDDIISQMPEYEINSFNHEVQDEVTSPPIDKQESLLAPDIHTKVDSEIKRLLAKNENRNTACSTNNWVKQYQLWAHEQQLPAELSTISPANLDKILQQFFAVHSL